MTSNKTVFVVSHRGVYAICSSREHAFLAKMLLRKARVIGWREMKIKQVLLDTIYPETVASHDKILMVEIGRDETKKKQISSIDSNCKSDKK